MECGRGVASPVPTGDGSGGEGYARPWKMFRISSRRAIHFSACYALLNRPESVTVNQVTTETVLVQSFLRVVSFPAKNVLQLRIGIQEHQSLRSCVTVSLSKVQGTEW